MTRYLLERTMRLIQLRVNASPSPGISEVNNIYEDEANSNGRCQHHRGQSAESATAGLTDCFIVHGLVYL